MGKWILNTQSNNAHLKPTQTHPFDTPNLDSLYVWSYVKEDKQKKIP